MVMITGKIRKETEKAVLFRNRGGQAWLPKSQIEILYSSMGPADQVAVPEWLANKDEQVRFMADTQH